MMALCTIDDDRSTIRESLCSDVVGTDGLSVRDGVVVDCCWIREGEEMEMWELGHTVGAEVGGLFIMSIFWFIGRTR